MWSGTVVGTFGRDVFVELSPRMQGVIGIDHFDQPPIEGERFDFTLRGQEDGLWVLARSEERPLVSWDSMQAGSLVQARVTGENHGGLELKIGPLHAFMPRSQCGLPRGTRPRELLGKTLTCEVIEVDTERQRVLVSRRTLIERERVDERRREVHQLVPGQVVRGRVTRLEPYGAFVGFGAGLEGLVHVSNLSLEPVGHPSEVLRVGQSVEVKVLTIRAGGRRIGLGLRQMHESPWKHLEESHPPGAIVEGLVTRTTDFGAFVHVERGVEGLLPAGECALPPERRLREHLSPGERITVRVLDLDVERERMTLSLLHSDRKRIARDEAAGIEALRERRAAGAEGRAATTLGPLLERALRRQHPPGPHRLEDD
ncbi:MAG TPA: S1 RNA-binding domain-containing protein [Planctomycetota bacterium]|nr:S1 RNA-binding domain-containing protein [Planctomycetota bacterium]